MAKNEMATRYPHLLLSNNTHICTQRLRSSLLPASCLLTTTPMLIKSTQQFCGAGLPANITVSKQGLVATKIIRGNTLHELEFIHQTIATAPPPQLRTFKQLCGSIPNTAPCLMPYLRSFWIILGEAGCESGYSDSRRKPHVIASYCEGL